jgi:hypothetical protein
VTAGQMSDSLTCKDIGGAFPYRVTRGIPPQATDIELWFFRLVWGWISNHTIN